MFRSRARHVAAFTFTQAVKTIRRPSRLISIPLIRIFRKFPSAAAFVPSILPDYLLDDLGGRTICLEVGYDLLQHDRPEDAWTWLERALHVGSPSIDDYLLGAMCLYHGLGRFRDAMSLLSHANELGLTEAESFGLANCPYRVLDSVWARHIGHIATIDYVIKQGILEGRSRENTILYLPPGRPIANRFLLQQIAAHLRLVKDPSDLPFDSSAVQALHYDYLGPRLPDRTTVYFWEIAGKTYNRWQQEGRGPLLTLPPEIEERGWAVLRDAGIPHDAWFVALHVREGKWDGRNGGLHGILNADIATYLPAIAEITRRGGWVIRMGDPGMKPLPPLTNVIDYCHSDLRADWMDVFIAARCRFMIGTCSGPALIPPIFGVPSVLTNWWPPAARPWHASDIFIPKMPRKLTDGRHLTLSETLSEPFSWCHSRGYLANHERVHVEENEPDIIRSAVEEMLARLAGEVTYNADVSYLRSRADQIYSASNCFGMGLLAAGFLQQHGDLVA